MSAMAAFDSSGVGIECPLPCVAVHDTTRPVQPIPGPASCPRTPGQGAAVAALRGTHVHDGTSGGDGTRTHDFLDATEALFQLSYTPEGIVQGSGRPPPPRNGKPAEWL